MRLLLDTHIWLWALLEPERLSANVQEALRAPETAMWLSSVSVWEAMLLVERRRIEAVPLAEVWVRNLIEALPCREATLTHEIAFASRSLALAHQDPADRFHRCDSPSA